MKILDYLKKNKGFLLVLFLMFAFRWSFADQYHVPSGSMEPTLQVGDRIGVSKLTYDLKLPFSNRILHKMSDPQRGDIVVFIWPGDQSTTFVKRLIGLPGDHLEIKNGFIFVNGQEVPRDRYQNHWGTLHYQEKLGEHQFTVQRTSPSQTTENIDVIVPPGSYFFMGDNRDNSLDSRSWGFVKRNALKGKVLGVLWNLHYDRFIPKMDVSRFLTAVN